MQGIWEKNVIFSEEFVKIKKNDPARGVQGQTKLIDLPDEDAVCLIDLPDEDAACLVDSPDRDAACLLDLPVIILPKSGGGYAR